MRTWTLDPTRITAAPYDLPYTAMEGQQDLQPIPQLSLREQADLWADDLRMPKQAAFVWLVVSGAGRSWRELASNPKACEALDALTSWRPSPSIGSNFSVVPSGFIPSDQASGDPLTRAARVAIAAEQVRLDFLHRRLPPEAAGKQHLDLSQMANVFRGIGVFRSRPRWCCPPEGANYFCVFCRGRPFFLPVPSAADLPALREALARIAGHARSLNEPALALLSAAGIKGFRSARWRQQPEVAERVNTIGAARFVLGLDLDSAPADENLAGYLTQVSFANRWYLHGCNLVVFGNGALGFNLAFGGGIDGNVGARFAAEVSTRVRVAEQAAQSTERPGEAYGAHIPAKSVRLTPRLETRLIREISPWIKSSPGVFTIAHGESACLASGARPVESFVTALSAALADLGCVAGGRAVRIPIRQFVSQGRFKFGALNAVDVNTPEVFAAALILSQDPDMAAAPRELRRAYAAAEDAVKRQTTRVRQSRRFSRRLTRGWVRRALAYLAVAPVLLAYRLRVLLTAPRTPIRAVAISYVAKKDGLAMAARPGSRAPRGMLWMHYQIFADRTVIVPCLGADCTVTEAEVAERLSARWKALLDKLAVPGN